MCNATTISTRKSWAKMASKLIAGADFSPCRIWRYALWRLWDWNGYANQVMFIGLNPSTADETQNDPTVTRCIRFAKSWGYSGMFMMNAYALRATDPRDMKAGRQFPDGPKLTDDPIGPGNDEALAYRKTHVGLIVAAWGNHCTPERERRICEVLNTPIYCLGKTKSGRPKHPLYLKSTLKPELFWTP